MKYRGVAYYPEYWPKERWDEDIRLMKEANINIVRIAEFAWSSLEPKEGVYTFEWLHDIISRLEKENIDVILCTVTATPPAWLTYKYPEICRVEANGYQHKHGMRRHYCPSNDEFIGFSSAITEKMSTDFAHHKNIVAWQLDNELGGDCYCESCQEKFRQHLKDKYKTIENLNNCWKTKFWSIEFSDWAEVRMEEGQFVHSSIRVECKRFRSDSYTNLADSQRTILRKYFPDAIIETNGMGPIFDPIDYYDMFKDLDVACDDLYFDISTMDLNTLALDVFRQLKPDQEFWLTETCSGALDESKTPDPKRLREWAFTSLAHGCNGYCFFRWRTCLSGQEQELQGLIEYNGLPQRRYKAVKDLFAELKNLEPLIEKCPLPTAEVAIINDYHNNFAYQSTRVNTHLKYSEMIYDVYNVLYHNNIPVDVIPLTRDLSRYKAIIMTGQMYIDEVSIKKLYDFVKNGGTLISGPQLSMRDVFNNYYPATAPVGLNELFGVNSLGGMYLRDYTGNNEAMFSPKAMYKDTTVTIQSGDNNTIPDGRAKLWMEEIETIGAKVIANYKDDIYIGCPAATINKYGDGKAVYLATFFDEKFLKDVLTHILEGANVGIKYTDMPKWVEIYPRGEYIFVINHTNLEHTVHIDATSSIIGSYNDGVVVLPAYGVTILKKIARKCENEDDFSVKQAILP